MLGGFLQASDRFEASTLDPLSREVVVMTIATRNGCRVCIAMHTGRLRQLAADPGTDHRAADPVDRWPTRGWRRSGSSRCGCWRPRARSRTAEVEEFLAAGYTTRNALEVVLGIGTYTMSTLANRLVRA